MKQKRKRVAKAAADEESLTEEQLQRLKENTQDLDESVYSYYTEKTDLNESVVLQNQFSGSLQSPDKQAKGSTPNLIVMADLEQNEIEVNQNFGDKTQQATILDHEDGGARKDTPPFDSYRSMPSQDQEQQRTELTAASFSQDIEKKSVVEVEHAEEVKVEKLEKEEVKVETIASATVESDAVKEKQETEETLPLIQITTPVQLETLDQKQEMSQSQDKPEPCQTQVSTKPAESAFAKLVELASEKSVNSTAQQKEGQTVQQTPSPTKNTTSDTKKNDQKHEEEEDRSTMIKVAAGAAIALVVCVGAFAFLRRK